MNICVKIYAWIYAHRQRPFWMWNWYDRGGKEFEAMYAQIRFLRQVYEPRLSRSSEGCAKSAKSAKRCLREAQFIQQAARTKRCNPKMIKYSVKESENAEKPIYSRSPTPPPPDLDITKIDLINPNITRLQEPLDDVNWVLWHEQMRRIFILCRVDPYIYGTLISPPPTSQAWVFQGSEVEKRMDPSCTRYCPWRVRPLVQGVSIWECHAGGQYGKYI